jgi:hypothetical protein
MDMVDFSSGLSKEETELLWLGGEDLPFGENEVQEQIARGRTWGHNATSPAEVRVNNVIRRSGHRNRFVQIHRGISAAIRSRARRKDGG